MDYKTVLEMVANGAAVLTALIATLAYGRFLLAQRARRRALECYLREEKSGFDDGGRRTSLHLMANLAMTEAEVLQAAFQSSRIRSVVGMDEQGRAVRLYFEYSGDDLPMPQKF